MHAAQGQDAIPQTIRSARCEGVFTAELFRIQNFRDWRYDDEISLTINAIPLQSGDFEGLINLKSRTSNNTKRFQRGPHRRVHH